MALPMAILFDWNTDSTDYCCSVLCNYTPELSNGYDRGYCADFVSWNVESITVSAHLLWFP